MKYFVNCSNFALSLAQVADQTDRVVAWNVGVLISDQHLEIDKVWEVRVKIDADRQDGRIIVEHFDRSRTPVKVNRRTYRLQDGEVIFYEDEATGKPQFKFRPASLKRVLRENFGITALVKSNPNYVFSGEF